MGSHGSCKESLWVLGRCASTGLDTANLAEMIGELAAVQFKEEASAVLGTTAAPDAARLATDSNSSATAHKA
eukprot:8205996-Pyramimonas_sp.AAC.1